MNTIIITLIVLIILALFYKKQESYYNVFGQWIDSPFDENEDGIQMSSPSYRLSKSPYYRWWYSGIPHFPEYYYNY